MTNLLLTQDIAHQKKTFLRNILYACSVSEREKERRDRREERERERERKIVRGIHRERGG